MAETQLLNANCAGEPSHKFKHLAPSTKVQETLCGKAVLSTSGEAFAYAQELLDGEHNPKFYCAACHDKAATLTGLHRKPALKADKANRV
jgi:hypothetical protein